MINKELVNEIRELIEEHLERLYKAKAKETDDWRFALLRELRNERIKELEEMKSYYR
jgi:hypothetical protein